MKSGLCEKHYYRMRRNGTLEPKRPKRPQREQCIVDGCAALDTGSSRLCGKHASRMNRHGNTTTVIIPSRRNFPRAEQHWAWTGDNANYVTMHQRVRRALGKAVLRSCVDCGNPAKHWSYNRRGVAEVVDKRGTPYSLDVNDYEPRCVSCHKRFDLDHVK